LWCCLVPRASVLGFYVLFPSSDVIYNFKSGDLKNHHSGDV
jgi:hypothetical protein